MLKIFIRRPVLSTVISVIIVLLGIVGMVQLPVAQYPDISPPTIQVSATYTGANADVVLKSVIVPLEEAINGVEGMSYMTSTATNTGSATISVYFRVGTNPDMDAVNVQNRVSSATSLLPATVSQAGVTVNKQQSSLLLIASLYSDNPAYDGTFLQNYAEINILPQLKRLNGVGNASVFGSRKYSMRIWLKPDKMAAYKLTPQDVNDALSEQNMEAAPGKFGENSDQSFQYVIRYTGQLKSVPEFSNIIVKASSDGGLVRLSDVARVELGAQDYSVYGLAQGKPAAMLAVSQIPGSNARSVILASEKVLEQAAGSLPAGVHYQVDVDINKFLDASIEKVVRTLVECFALVFLVIFIFLQDVRSTIIHGVSVPVAITGTFFFLYLFGYSINLLTLFALVLAIGIVVDDAIVVVEAVHAKLEQGYRSPRKAAIDAMGEISGAIVSITLVMSAVFIPVTFIGGSTGVFFKQFGVTLAVAILISAINALTLCPALAALFLKPLHEEEGATIKRRFQQGFNAAYAAMAEKYSRCVRFLTHRTWIAAIAVLFFGTGFYLLFTYTPSSFVPDEDMGVVFVNITLPPASSLERSGQVADTLDKMLSTVPGVERSIRLVGQNFLAGSGSSYAILILELKDWGKRKGITNNDVIQEINRRTAHFKDADLLSFSLPTITGFSNSGGFEFQLEDKGGHSTAEFYQVAQSFLAGLRKRPEIMFASTPFNPNFPQYLMEVNVARCKQANISVSSLLNTISIYYGASYASNFTEFGKQYRVMVQADTAYRASIEGLNKIYIRVTDSGMAPVSSFISMHRVYGPESISRFNLFSSMSVSGSPSPAYSTGQALQAIRDVAARSLPSGYGYEFSGISLEEENSGTQTVYIFILSLVFVYFILSGLYESYLLPLAVLLSLPVGLTGQLLFARLFGLDKNIYMQVCMVMLIGLLSKNAILIVEFAIDRRRLGMPLVQSAIEGAQARLRPILMTSFAFIFGLMPLMFSSGVGAHGNRSIGTGAIGGMLTGTILGVFLTPVLYVLFQGLQERFSGPARPLDEPEDEHNPIPIRPLMVILFAGLFFSSCKVTQPYSKPATALPTHYRDQAMVDTTTLATLPWRSLFSDPKLQALIQEGLSANLDIKSAIETIHSSEATLQQSRAALLPSLSADAGATIQKLSSAQTYGISVPSSPVYQVYLSSSWEADIWGKLKSSKKAALAGFYQSVAALQGVQTKLIADIADDYYTLLAYDAELTITHATIDNRKQDVETMRALLDGDVVTAADVVESEANLHSAEVSQYDIESQIRTTENALSVLLGRPAGPIDRSTLESQIPLRNLETGIPSQLLRNRPDILQAEYAYREAFETTNAARAYFYPTLSITAEGGLYAMAVKDFFSAGNLFGELAGGLTQPIFQQGTNKARLKQAKASQAKALNDYQSTLLNAGAEVSNDLFSYEQAIHKQVVRSAQIESLKKAVDYTHELLKYTANTNYNDVLTSEQNLLTAQLNGVADKLQELQAIVDLYVALGGGWQPGNP
ncbi:efflux RND transporter permease subunit [Dinghuibacter silviterrae]|uniref:Hydrophobe/amphiphile efflux-1 (HAE1) family protein/NodT family efflux transporter outer membrane factor (OMF) lipoprotein n=1 Tax=Dinghuibacter silviterrae TaxID=1539049 RepID=A0A4R8DI17_9BACT|nr:efflux RND transporter permease subunit [Dinghuibacter silviterrae]TDW97185.1 hydrophobe/amphiphile efflux-1 (HAE1) family protein/NodT family efflux transporter outer membrane factor (OMF) lipoprotein [Dinghuibacter silviterrae]